MAGMFSRPDLRSWKSWPIERLMPVTITVEPMKGFSRCLIKAMPDQRRMEISDPAKPNLMR
ncbi:MAG TPA: hypothetical protein VNN22_17200 [Verrucomicrobiae bacterium]|nr:hypothetical protein [Verrucomicrobiae bacterium]